MRHATWGRSGLYDEGVRERRDSQDDEEAGEKARCDAMGYETSDGLSANVYRTMYEGQGSNPCPPPNTTCQLF